MFITITKENIRNFYQVNTGPIVVRSQQTNGSQARSSNSPNKRTPTKRGKPATIRVASKTPTKEPVAGGIRSNEAKTLGLKTRGWQI